MAVDKESSFYKALADQLTQSGGKKEKEITRDVLDKRFLPRVWNVIPKDTKQTLQRGRTKGVTPSNYFRLMNQALYELTNEVTIRNITGENEQCLPFTRLVASASERQMSLVRNVYDPTSLNPEEMGVKDLSGPELDLTLAAAHNYILAVDGLSNAYCLPVDTLRIDRELIVYAHTQINSHPREVRRFFGERGLKDYWALKDATNSQALQFKIE